MTMKWQMAGLNTGSIAGVLVEPMSLRRPFTSIYGQWFSAAPCRAYRGLLVRLHLWSLVPGLWTYGRSVSVAFARYQCVPC